ncbi:MULTISPECIES: hypothetical protein [unclassified Colwellia]|jgi:hypothetical protein|uniref:hypothetical protein n=1 Tax=unclassified Colwellia TaxID=196834 RepID=UPI0015F67A1D|nr:MULTISPECIES: hypothetical protein [unclassified Colwellia]MBA6232242.1 hypothetical protein [Colwellia sp. MB02u-7]MBA6235675.1 hypothetical protein [Colwellia sp. MB02u-11]MBA6254582.1 hypothetical protein [Colwellia sp. MB3u-28]MBA6258498.1 hypothetical protein [Colwellia sp. MB3u-41]MBA6297884.1 hypothetical protein [Colwellia sp. MB3u-22]
MRKFLCLVILSLSFSSYANSQFEGLWEGFQANDPHISSHLMVINSEGKGYYIIGLGDELAEQSFALINLNGAEFKNGFIDIPLHKYDTGQASSHLVISKDLLDGNLNCLTVYHDKNGIPIMSFNWPLRKSKTGFAKNNELYKFAQELYNKQINKD